MYPALLICILANGEHILGRIENWDVEMVPQKCVVGTSWERMRGVTCLDCLQHIWHTPLPPHFKMPLLTCVNVNKYISLQKHTRSAQCAGTWPWRKNFQEKSRLSPGKYSPSTVRIFHASNQDSGIKRRQELTIRNFSRTSLDIII